METRLSGSAFPDIGREARLPTAESLNCGTMRRLVPEEWRERRPDTSATWLSGTRYRGAALQRTLWVSTAILNSIRSGTQCHIKNRLQSPYEVSW